MLNKDFYEEKLDEIRDALDEETAWYNPREYDANFDKGWWEGYALGFITIPMISALLALLWLFIHSASH